MKTFEGNVVAKDVKVAIVAARFNEFIVSKLIGGAEDALLRHGVKEDDITLAWVPGAFEIPVMLESLTLCLGFQWMSMNHICRMPIDQLISNSVTTKRIEDLGNY